MEGEIEEDIVCPCRHDGIMSRHDNFSVLTIEQEIALAPISNPNQPVLGNLGQGKPPNIEAMNCGGKTSFERKRGRNVGIHSRDRYCALVENQYESDDHTNRCKCCDNLGGDRTDEPDNHPKLPNKGNQACARLSRKQADRHHSYDKRTATSYFWRPLS